MKAPRVPLLLLLLTASCAGVRPRPAADGPGETYHLREVLVSTDDIYEDEDAQSSLLVRLVNATHHRTREAVVRREVWLRPGDLITEADARELERNLRATGLFAEVTAALVPVEEGWVTLDVATRDRLSIGLGASGSFIGAVSSLGASLSESNLFGVGDRIAVAFTENSEDEFRGAVSYYDRHLLGTWVSGSLQVGRTEEGDFAAVGLSRPFKYLADRRSWSIHAATTESDRDYFEAGETVAEVPQKSDSASASMSWRHGPEDAYWTTGVVLSHSATDYGAARGPASGTIDVPGDTTKTFAGTRLGFRTIEGFRELQRVDTLGYVQDVTLGTDVSVLLGGLHIEEEGDAPHVEPSLGLNSSAIVEAAGSTFLAFDLGGNLRMRAGDAQAWTTSAELRAFELGFEPHTLALRAAYDEAFEDQGLPVQLVLGEGQGLRGYPAREFTGERVVRLNLEDRVRLGARVGSFEIGAVAFLDMAWIEDRGQGFGRPYRSVGFGLRVGSDALLGSRVVRIDLAFPLDDVDGRSFDPLVSVSLGQIFGL